MKQFHSKSAWGKRARQSLNQFIHSIRFHLVLWFVLILGVVMVVFSAFIYYRQVQDLRSVAISRLNYTLEHVLNPLDEREGLANQPLISLPAISGNTSGISTNLQQGEVVALQAPDGTVQLSLGVLSTAQIQALNLPLHGWNGVAQYKVPKTNGINSGIYLFTDPAIVHDGQVAGYLLVGVPLDANNQLGRLLISLVLGNLFTLAIALTGGFWLADRAMRPVHTITQAARQISESDLHKRLNLKGQDELAELGNTFDGMLSRLQAAFERQRQFTADASHELRTPLTIIELETTRGLTTRRSADEYEHILGTVQAENKFMIRLVNNLLSLARMDAGQLKLNFETLDLSKLASEVIERVKPLAVAYGVQLAVGDLSQTLVYGDRATLLQMLTNLVENAVKYSAPVTNPKVEILVGQDHEGGTAQAWVKVKDNGIGISAENQAHIFDRFYQVEKSRNRADAAEADESEQESSGTGLGLAIAQWIVKAHGGEIKVESTPGQGSIFVAILPSAHVGH
jgi:two-component system OmpR family sensor kinase